MESETLMKKYKRVWDRCWAWICAPLIKWLNRRLWRNPNDLFANNVANGITVLRGIAMTYLVYGLATADPSHRGMWLIIMFFVQLTDGADGAVARGTGTTDDRGSTLDGGVDKYSALLLLSALILWIRPEFSPMLAALYMILLVLIVLAEALCIMYNKERQKLCEQLGEKFSSRLPAQIKFIVSMLILGSCWLTTDASVAFGIFEIGIPVILVLTIWSAGDYRTDRDDLQWQLYSP